MTTRKPRGADDGPKRAPPHLGDAWQNKPSNEVEELIPCLIYYFINGLSFHPCLDISVLLGSLGLQLSMSKHFKIFRCLFSLLPAD